MRAERALFIHEGIAGSMQIEQILFEYLSVLERIGRAKGNKGLSNSKIGGTGEYFMPRYRPKVGKETKEIAQIPFHNRNNYFSTTFLHEGRQTRVKESK